MNVIFIEDNITVREALNSFVEFADAFNVHTNNIFYIIESVEELKTLNLVKDMTKVFLDFNLNRDKPSNNIKIIQELIPNAEIIMYTNHQEEDIRHEIGENIGYLSKSAGFKGIAKCINNSIKSENSELSFK